MGNICFENPEVCSKCGGLCCQKCGCDYSALDFESLKLEELQKVLERGDVSIVSYQHFYEFNGHYSNVPFLYMRARNVNRPVIDLLSFKTTCASWVDKKCKYSFEDRPSGGVNLIPVENGGCYPYVDCTEIAKTWENYQKVLARLVKRFTGKSVEEKLREDVLQLFHDILNENYEGVSCLEIVDVLGMLPMLQRAYPKEYAIAVEEFQRKNGNPKLKILRNKESKK